MLSALQVIKLKSATKNASKVTLKLSLKMTADFNDQTNFKAL